MDDLTRLPEAVANATDLGPPKIRRQGLESVHIVSTMGIRQNLEILALEEKKDDPGHWLVRTAVTPKAKTKVMSDTESEVVEPTKNVVVITGMRSDGVPVKAELTINVLGHR